MSGPLNHSLADLLQVWLVDQGLAVDPDEVSSWQAFVGQEPNGPDNCITLFDTEGNDDGRSMVSGRRWKHYGFQVRIRSVDQPTGFAKGQAIAVALSEDLYQATVSLGGDSYSIHSVTLTSDVLRLGEAPDSKRHLFTLNGVAPVKMTS